MRAASEGACAARGVVIGISPERPAAADGRGYPNEFVDIAVFTGMYDARNVINAKTPHCLIALAGGADASSEIALALRRRHPVIGLNAPEVSFTGAGGDRPGRLAGGGPPAMDRILARGPAGLITGNPRGRLGNGATHPRRS